MSNVVGYYELVGAANGQHVCCLIGCHLVTWHDSSSLIGWFVRPSARSRWRPSTRCWRWWRGRGRRRGRPGQSGRTWGITMAVIPRDAISVSKWKFFSIKLSVCLVVAELRQTGELCYVLQTLLDSIFWLIFNLCWTVRHEREYR